MKTQCKSRAAALALAIAIYPVRPAHAQTLEDVLRFLVTNQSVQTGSVERDRAAAQATSDTISRALLANLATLPVASSSGAFVYRFNPELGTFERPTQTFGPFFLERALTAGRGNASFGVTFQQFRFTSLDGRNLRDGSLVTTANQFRDEAAPFDVDQLTLNIDASVATLYGTVGVTHHMEVGFAAPYISLNIDGTRVNTYRGRTFTQASGSGHATGLADMLVRTKYTLYDDENTALAAAVDLRLPTGRQEDLLGAGSASIKFTAIGSVEAGRLSAHANAGLTRGGLANELSYGAGLEVAASGRFSVGGELLGRYIDSSGHILSVTAPHPTLNGVNTIRLTGDTSNLQILTAVPGFKWNLSSTWVLAGSVTVPLTSGGLTAPITPFVGLDYALGR
ncbi:MAG TPA: transporter [Vicinamibacterales bacterium]|nr:transporter [Vicinamibacterales bacterium]